MNATARLFQGTFCMALAIGLGGCAAMDLSRETSKNASENLSQKRKLRAEEATQQFNESRDFAEYQAAFSSWNQRDFKGCEAALDRLLRHNPNHRDGRLMLAELCINDGRTQAAFDQIEQTLQTHGDDAYVQYSAAVLMDATGDCNGALAYYRRATEIEPGNELYAVGYRTAMAAATREIVASAAGATRSSLGDPSSGRVESAGFVTVSDTDPLLAQLRQGEDALAEGATQRALQCFLAAAAMQPDNPQIPISTAVSALQKKQPALSVRLLTSAGPSITGSARAHRILGVAHYRLGDFQSSEVALQQALSLDKSNALTYFLLGCTMTKVGQFEAAEEHFRQARTLDPRYAVRR